MPLKSSILNPVRLHRRRRSQGFIPNRVSFRRGTGYGSSRRYPVSRSGRAWKSRNTAVKISAKKLKGAEALRRTSKLPVELIRVIKKYVR